VPANFFIANLLAQGMGILYGISLIFSKTGKSPWLKAAGIFLFLLELTMMSTFIWAISSHDVLLNGRATIIEQWVSLIICLVPVLFILNFWRDRDTSTNVSTSRQANIINVINLGAFIALLSTLFFGFRIANESMWLSGNLNHVSENLEKIAQPFEARTFVNR
jgi:hypothetical protein